MYDIIKHDNYICIRPESNIDSVTAFEFQDTVLSNIYKLKPKIIIIDFIKISHIDSIVCGVILHLFQKLAINNIFFEITNVSKEVFNLFSTMRLNRLFKINCY